MGDLYTRKRGEKWEYRFETAPVDGKRKQTSKGGFRTKADAIAAGTKALAEYNAAGLKFEPTEISVADYLNLWFDKAIMPNLRYNTKLDYWNIIDKHLIPRFGNYRLKAINPTVLIDWSNDLKMKGYSKSHIVGIMTTFGAALDYAVQPLMYIPYNPMQYVKYPKVDRKPRERIILAPDEWDKIIKRFPFGNRFHVSLMIGYYTGLRIGEVMGLTWEDIDLDAGTLSVTKQMVKRNQGNEVRKAQTLGAPRCQASQWYIAPTKTKASIRTIKIGQTLIDCLRREKQRQRENELKYGEYYTINYTRIVKDEMQNDIVQVVPLQKSIPAQLPPLRLVNIDENGEITTPDSVKYCTRVIRHELKIAFDFHALRHTHATRLIEGGASPKAVQARLGHSKIETTLQTYVHNTSALEADAVDIFERSVSDSVRAAK